MSNSIQRIVVALAVGTAPMTAFAQEGRAGSNAIALSSGFISPFFGVGAAYIHSIDPMHGLEIESLYFF